MAKAIWFSAVEAEFKMLVQHYGLIHIRGVLRDCVCLHHQLSLQAEVYDLIGLMDLCQFN